MAIHLRATAPTMLSTAMPRSLRRLATMRCVLAEGGKALVRTVPRPTALPGHVLMRVQAASLNRADLLQVAGRYPPPAGVTHVLGLEAAGTLEDGTLACALVSGGALAEYVQVPSANVIRIPALNATQLAAIPEAFLVAHHLLFQIANFQRAQCVLIHAAGSGVGTAAVQLANCVPDATVIGTTRTREKAALISQLGATHVVHANDAVDAVRAATHGKGADVVLDCVGAAALHDNARAIAQDGIWILYGLLGGARGELDMGRLLTKRVNMHCTTLRSRDADFKAQLVKQFIEQHAPKFAIQLLRPVLDRVFDGLEETPAALSYMRENLNIGKVVIKIA